MEPGSLVLFSPRTTQDYGVHSSASHWESVWSHFHPLAHWLDLLALPKVADGLRHLSLHDHEVKERVRNSLLEMHRLAAGRMAQSERLAINALEAALLWCDVENPVGSTANIDPRVRRAIEYIVSDLTRRVELDALARRCGLSRSRLWDLFHAQLGMSPHQFQEQHRIERARQLLALTSRSVAEIGLEVGFASQFYFSLRFKKRTSMSPKAYRKSENLKKASVVPGPAPSR